MYNYSWLSWGVTSLLEGKSWSLHLAQLCGKYRQGTTMLSPYCYHRKIKEAVFLKQKLHHPVAS